MASDKTANRRRYSPEFKAKVMGECDVLGASVAKVAMSHGINTNVVHGWRKLARGVGGPTGASPRESSCRSPSSRGACSPLLSATLKSNCAAAR
ncbi:MAG: transposase [Rubrivivax sp.]|nr:transposase [Rubrivivax sp.]